MAKQTKLPVEQCKTFIANYYARYPGVKLWQDTNIETVKANRKRSNRRTMSGLPAGVSKYFSITGRIYTFYEQDAPEFMRDKGTDTSFSPTAIKNYMVQGFATGDIVPIMLGLLRKELLNSKWKDDALLINSVHDSVVLDVKKEVVYDVGVLVKKTLESAPLLLKEVFGIDFDLPLKVDVGSGPSYGEQTKLSI